MLVSVPKLESLQHTLRTNRFQTSNDGLRLYLPGTNVKAPTMEPEEEGKGAQLS